MGLVQRDGVFSHFPGLTLGRTGYRLERFGERLGGLDFHSLEKTCRRQAGDVIDIRPFQFTVMEIGGWVEADQSTGRIIHVPNSTILNQSLINYSKGFQYIWNEIPVLITFESDWKKAKIILQSILDKHAEHPGEKAEKNLKEAGDKFLMNYYVLTPTVYTSVKDVGVLLTLRYLTEPRKRHDSEQTVWEKILEEFDRCEDIDFAYPTQRFYNNNLESKRETKPAGGDRLKPSP